MQAIKDWTGNATAIFATHGASNHSTEERAEKDYYATDPAAVEKLLEVETFKRFIFEPACGGCHISRVLLERGYNCFSSDIVNRGSDLQITEMDFLQYNPNSKNSSDIITNPPYKYAKEFVEHALDISVDGVKVAMFLKLTFLESEKRRKLFDKYPPKVIYVFTNRVDCWKNGIKPQKAAKAVCYAWFIWEKGYIGNTIIKRI